MTADGGRTPRVRVICDNDFAGDPDGLVQLAHHLLCSSTDIRGVVGGLLAPYDPSAGPDSAERSAAEARAIAAMVGRDVTVVAGANEAMVELAHPRTSAGAELIICEAMRADTDTPLFVACGGALTNVASALLLEPRIVGRLTVVWIGGSAYPDLAPSGDPGLIETNASIDPVSARTVFDSDLSVWQVPLDMYGQVLVSLDALAVRMAPHGRLGAFLYDRLVAEVDGLDAVGFRVGEAYVLGDSPLVLLTALTGRFADSPQSCRWVSRARPTITDSGAYGPDGDRPPIRVFTYLDTAALLEDLYAKVELHARRESA